MNDKFISKANIKINAPVSKVWGALTKPDLIKQYMFGTEVTTDWQVGSSITYKGEWQGKSYEDKGKILEIEPGKILASTYWSSMSGKADASENYQTVRYELSAEGSNTTSLTVTQDNNNSQEEANHSEENWKMVLDGIKKLLEDSSS